MIPGETCPTCGHTRPVTSSGSKIQSQTWARFVSAVRQRMGCNKREFAALIGVSESYISRFERGGWVPSYHCCVQISERLSVSKRDVMEAAGYYDRDEILEAMEGRR